MKKFNMNLKSIFILSFFGVLFSPLGSWAKLSVVTTTTDLSALASEVGGDKISVQAIAKGTQDPHHIEAKPSFMVQVSHADLLISIGLGLEDAWINSIVDGARNPKVRLGEKGRLVVGQLVSAIEIPGSGISRAEGDIHPEGNPHITLDPDRMATIAAKMAERFSELDAPNAGFYAQQGKLVEKRLKEKLKGWDGRLKKTGIKKVVTYHKILNYFLDRFHIENVINLEPKPGVQPTARHLLTVIDKVKAENIKLILVENFFDPKIAQRVKDEVPSVHLVSVPVSVGGDSDVKTLDDLYEKLVKTFEEASR